MPKKEKDKMELKVEDDGEFWYVIRTISTLDKFPSLLIPPSNY